MVEGVSNNLTTLQEYQLTSEYQDVIDTLKQAFPGMTESELEQEILDYLAANQDQDLADIDFETLVTEISKALNVSLSAETISAIKDEWEDLTCVMDIDVSELVDVLDSYAPGEIRMDREYLVMLWQMLQGELEDAAGDEAIAVTEADKKITEQKFQEYLDKTVSSLEANRDSEIVDIVLKWAGVAASLIGAAASCVAAVVACVTGVGVGVGIAMFAAAGIMLTLAAAGTTSAFLDLAGVDWELGSLTGTGIAELINACGANIDVEEFAGWFAFGVQTTLMVVAVLCTLGAGAGTMFSSSASTGTNLLSTLFGATAKGADAAANATKALNAVNVLIKGLEALAQFSLGVIEIAKGVDTVILSYTEADLVAIKAMLEKMREIQNMDQEMTEAFLQIIFQAIRGDVADAMDTVLQDFETIVNLNRA